MDYFNLVEEAFGEADTNIIDNIDIDDLNATIDCKLEDVVDYWNTSAYYVARDIYGMENVKPHQQRIAIDKHHILITGYEATYLIRLN